MRNTGGTSRGKSNKDKGSSKSAQPSTQNTHTVKSEGPPLKAMQPTAEQLALNNLIHSSSKEATEDELQKKIKQIVELTGCTQEKAEIALYDNKNDMDRAVNHVLEGGDDEDEWRESGKKKKKQKPEPAAMPPVENNVEQKAERRENRERNDRDNRDRNKEENGERTFREPSDNYRQRQRRNDNRPPRLARGRGRPDRAGDRPDREEDNFIDKDDNRERGFDRGRGRGRGFGPRRGRGGGNNFRPSRGGGFDNNKSPSSSQFDNGPQIDTWTNETAVIGEKEPKISNWGDSKEDWNEDIDSWTGSLAETKVFTASTTPAPEPPSNPVQMEPPTALSNTFDIGVLYPKHAQTDSIAEASYITQFNQQATESIKNSIGIGTGPSSSLQNSMTSQTASNVSALVSLQQNALHDPLGPSLNVSELTGNSLTASGLAGNSLVGTSLGNSLSTSLPVNSLTGGALHSTSLSGNSMTSLSGTSLAGNSLTGTSVTGSGLTGSMTGNSSAAQSGVIPASSVSQNAMLQQRKPQRSKLPPPSKIPASAVEMPGHMMTTLDVQFGNLEFGSDSGNAAFSFGGGNESVTNAFSNAETISSTSTMDGAGPVPGLNKPSETLISAALEHNSSRSSSLYQQSPYTTPTKQTSPDNSNNINSPPDPIQLPGSGADLKSNSLIPGQNPQVSLPTSKMDSNLGSYSTGPSYQSAGYQSQKTSSGFNNQSTKPGAYPGTQYPTTPSQNQSTTNQFSSQYRQSNQNQYQSSGSQFPSGSQYQSPPSGYQSSQTGYQSPQSGFQSNQTQYQTGQGQFQNFQSSSSFQNQSNYSSNQPSQSALYPSTTSASFSNQSQQNSLYSQNSRPGTYSNQSYLNEQGSGAGPSFQTSVTQSNTGFKENQTGASSFRGENVPSASKTRDSQTDSSTYNRDTQSASSFSDSQSMAYNRDSQSVGSSYNRDPSNSYKRDSKSASGSFPRDTPPTDNSSTYNRDSQSASASYNVRDSQTSSTGFRDTQSGASGYGNQAGSYPRESGQSQSQAGYSAKNYRNTTEVTSLQSSLTGSKLVDNFSKMAVKDGALDNIQSTNSQYENVTSTSKVTTNSTALTSSTTSTTVSSTGTTVINSTTTKISTLTSASSASSKAAPNLPPGVPLMAAQQYIMGQAGTLPFYGLQGLQGLQQPLYANVEDFQYLRQGMPPLATSNMYDMTANAAAAGLPIPPTSLNSNSTQQTIPTVPYSVASNDTNKLPRVDAQSPTGSVAANSQQAGTGQSATHQQPYIHLNYSYYYPPSLIPGAGFQYPMIPMPQVTNAAHATPANTQYQQKNYGTHVQYGTNKMYDDITAQTGADFSKSPYGTSQTQPKANINSTVTVGSGSSDIQIPGYGGKTHAQAFDKQGFHAGTPPPFNLQMAAGQLATGTQAGPLGAPTAAFGGPFVPMMTHQPHSQMMHHPLQDTSSSNRGSQQSGGHSQSKSSSKSYNASNWGSY